MKEQACVHSNVCKDFHPDGNAEPDFGDYVKIMMKRHGVPDEIYIHKVIGTLASNKWVDVPVKSPATETVHDEMDDVVACVCGGVCEREIMRYRAQDVSIV